MGLSLPSVEASKPVVEISLLNCVKPQRRADALHMLAVELHIFYHNAANSVNQTDDIILSIAEIVILSAVIVYGDKSTLRIITIELSHCVSQRMKH